MQWICLFAMLMAGFTQKVCSQPNSYISPRHFFESDSLLHFSLQANFTYLQQNRSSDSFLRGSLQLWQQKQPVLEERVLVRNRGHFRRELCFPPPILIDFKSANDSSSLRKLGKLKLVTACADDDYSNQLLIKEFLVYKLYQLFTPMSFRVKLVQMDYADEKKSNFSRSRYAFFLEDVDDMARRNGCRETESRFAATAIDRKASTVFFLFQYMIGNTDWAIPLNRNLKFIYPADKPNAPPIPVPYDFDYCGLVNANYANPSEIIPISNVRERYYMGFERTETELMEALSIFLRNKLWMYELIEQCPYLPNDDKKDIIYYLEGFFQLLQRKDDVVETFVNRARKK